MTVCLECLASIQRKLKSVTAKTWAEVPEPSVPIPLLSSVAGEQDGNEDNGLPRAKQ